MKNLKFKLLQVFWNVVVAFKNTVLTKWKSSKSELRNSKWSENSARNSLRVEKWPVSAEAPQQIRPCQSKKACKAFWGVLDPLQSDSYLIELQPFNVNNTPSDPSFVLRVRLQLEGIMEGLVTKIGLKLWQFTESVIRFFVTQILHVEALKTKICTLISLAVQSLHETSHNNKQKLKGSTVQMQDGRRSDGLELRWLEKY